MTRETLLAIDTATDSTGIAIFDGTLRGEVQWRSERNQTRELIPAIQWLLRQLHLIIEEVGALGVVTGPGSFSGLRVGIATAKGLCAARNLPVVGIGTLEAIAYQHRETMRAIRPLCDAGRGEVATALFRAGVGRVTEIESQRLTSPEQLAREVTEPTLICGNIHAGWQRTIGEIARDLVSFPSAAAMLPRAGYLAEVCWDRWQCGQVDDPASLQPAYPRRPATTPSRH